MTPIVPLDQLVAALTDSLETATNVQIVVPQDAGAPVSVQVTADYAAAAVEALAAVRDHLLENTRNPVVSSFIVSAFESMNI